MVLSFGYVSYLLQYNKINNKLLNKLNGVIQTRGYLLFEKISSYKTSLFSIGAILLGACWLTVQRMTTNWATATVEETKEIRLIQADLDGLREASSMRISP